MPGVRPGPPAAAPPTCRLSWVDRALVESIADAHGEPGWLRDDRLAALAAFEALPVESNRLYTPYVDLRAASLDDATPDLWTATGDGATPPAGEAVAARIELREDGIGARSIDPAVAAAGVRVLTLPELVAQDEPLARSLLDGAPLLPTGEKLAELSRAAWTTGVVVHVPAGVRVERPIVIRWTLGTPRSLVGADASSCSTTAPRRPWSRSSWPPTASSPGVQALFSATTEIRLGANARLAMASLQELGPDHVVFQQRRAHIGEGADLRWALAQLGGRLVRSRVDNVLAGDRSTVEQVEIVFGGEDQLHDLTSYTRHVGRDTTGQLLSKGVLLDRARSYMKGLIQIEKTAIGTDSYLGEFGMNLSKSARAVAIPSLEIDQPDCRRAAHASSVGPIDETQLFYLESRGIHPDEARKFIVLGFLEPVVVRVPLEEAQDRLRDALEAKWSAGLAAGSATAA